MRDHVHGADVGRPPAWGTMGDMAELDTAEDEVVVRLSPLEKLGAFRGDVHVPRSAVRDVRIALEPFAELRGLRIPGTDWPRRIALGGGVVSGGISWRSIAAGRASSSSSTNSRRGTGASSCRSMTPSRPREV